MVRSTGIYKRLVTGNHHLEVKMELLSWGCNIKKMHLSNLHRISREWERQTLNSISLVLTIPISNKKIILWRKTIQEVWSNIQRLVRSFRLLLKDQYLQIEVHQDDRSTISMIRELTIAQFSTKKTIGKYNKWMIKKWVSLMVPTMKTIESTFHQSVNHLIKEKKIIVLWEVQINMKTRTKI